MAHNTLRGALAALALSAVVATPAMAAPVAYDGTDWTYGDTTGRGLDYDNFDLDDTEASAAWIAAHPDSAGHSRTSGNWDGRGEITVDETGDYYVGNNLEQVCTQEAVGNDWELVCDEEELQPGIFVHPEYRSIDALGIERLVWIFRSTNADTTSVIATTSENSECDGNGFAKFSNGWSGHTANTADDINASSWSVQREADDDNAGCAIETVAWQVVDPENPAESTTDTNLGYYTHTFTFDVPANGTKALAFFYSDGWIDTGDAQSLDLTNPADPYVVGRQAAFDAQIAVANANMVALNAANSVGLDPNLDIVNWNPATPVADLAETGTDATGFALAGFALVAAGAIVALRRRAKS